MNAVVRRDRTAALTEVVADDAGLFDANTMATDRCSISANGQWIAYSGGGTGFLYTKVRNMAAAAPFTASVHLSGALPQLLCRLPVISADGKWVAWETQASNLVADDTNGFWDVYVRGPLW